MDRGARRTRTGVTGRAEHSGNGRPVGVRAITGVTDGQVESGQRPRPAYVHAAREGGRERASFRRRET